jgi:molybdopterin-guanine dinucleotide biosynthesis protein A
VMILANRNAGEYAAFAPVVADDSPGFRGPLAGIATALAHCRTPWLLTASVDVPEPPLDLASKLMNATADIAVAHDGERRQPLFALYSRKLASAAKDALERDLAVWRWQDEHGAVEVDFSIEPAAFHNLNTPDDFRNWENARHG